MAESAVDLSAELGEELVLEALAAELVGVVDSEEALVEAEYSAELGAVLEEVIVDRPADW